MRNFLRRTGRGEPRPVLIHAHVFTKRRRIRQCAGLVLWALVAASPLGADVLHLASGGRIEGEVTEVEDGYWLENEAGRVFLERGKVVRWEKLPSAEDDYRALSRTVALDDFQGHMMLAAWCRRNNLHERARWHYLMAVALRPEDPVARQGAGYVRMGPKWVTHDEAMHLQGYAEYQGKWLPAAEALRQQLADERQDERRRVYHQAWVLVRKIARQRPDEPFVAAARELANLGPLVLEPLDRAAADGSPRARALTLHALARRGCAESRALLLRRLRAEPTKDLTHLAAHLLARRPDRLEVLTTLLDMAVNDPVELYRRRAWLGLQACQDRRAIDALILKAEYSPVEEAGEAAKTEKEEKTLKKATPEERTVVFDGKKYVSGAPKKKPAYYPAHDALVYLTDMMLPRNVKAWQNWWDHKREEFEFAPLSEAPAAATVEDLPPPAIPSPPAQEERAPAADTSEKTVAASGESGTVEP